MLCRLTPYLLTRGVGAGAADGAGGTAGADGTAGDEGGGDEEEDAMPMDIAI